jgi:zinc protease
MDVRPVPGKPRAYRFPVTERRTLDSGVRVAVARLEQHTLVSCMAVFHRAGAHDDPPGREGLAQLTASMLLEGSESRDGSALADYFESLGSSLSASSDWDSTILSFTVQPKHLDAALRGLRDVVRHPAFRQRDLSRLQAEHRAARLQIAADPRELGDEAFAWACYAGRSRYRRPIDGTAATVDALTREHVVEFWREQYAPSALTIVIAGDVTVDGALGAATTLVEGWEAQAPRARELDVSARYSTGQFTLVEKPGAAQTELRIGHIGVPRSHPSYFPMTVMNAVLGGLFSSRINLNLRERHGYTYGAFSSFDWRCSAGPWCVSTAVKSEVSGDAVREVLTEIDRMRATPIERDELELAANYLVGVFPLRFETTSAVATALASQATLSLPADYFDTYRDLMSAVSPDHVLEAAREFLRPEQLQVVAVGDPDVVEPLLTPLASGGLIRRAPEQVEVAE